MGCGWEGGRLWGQIVRLSLARILSIHHNWTRSWGLKSQTASITHASGQDAQGDLPAGHLSPAWAALLGPAALSGRLCRW